MNNLAEWISAFANVAVAAGLAFAWWQLRAYREEIRATHERADRERAVDAIALWALNGDRKGAIARKLVEKLSRPQVRKIVDQLPLNVDKEDGDALAGIFDDMPPIANDRYALSVKHSSELRWIITSYLNRLEASLAGWQHKIASEKIIVEQYSFLVNNRDGHHILAHFRAALKEDHERDPYPAIEKLARHLDAHRQDSIAAPLDKEKLGVKKRVASAP